MGKARQQKILIRSSRSKLLKRRADPSVMADRTNHELRTLEGLAEDT